MSEAKQSRASVTTSRPLPDVWDVEAKRLVRSAMQLHGYTYRSLATALEASGERAVSPTALALRISRGTFTLGFALQVLRVMGTKSIDISHVKARKVDAGR